MKIVWHVFITNNDGQAVASGYGARPQEAIAQARIAIGNQREKHSHGARLLDDAEALLVVDE